MDDLDRATWERRQERVRCETVNEMTIRDLRWRVGQLEDENRQLRTERDDAVSVVRAWLPNYHDGVDEAAVCERPTCRLAATVLRAAEGRELRAIARAKRDAGAR